MRVLILSGGQGTRLLPLTNHMPKIMVPIHGKPFIHYLCRWLKGHDLVMSVGPHRKPIKSWCKDNNVLAEFIDEPEALGTGGALRLAEPFFETNRKFAVINGDTFLDTDLVKIGKTHKGMATVVEARSMLDGIIRPAGIYILSNRIFKKLDRPKVFNLDERLKCIEFNIYTSTKKYLDIGTHEGLKCAKEGSIFRGKKWEKE